VEQRTREIGIRIALGATNAGTLRLILRQNLAWGLGGMAIGFAGALAFTRTLPLHSLESAQLILQRFPHQYSFSLL
jgi:ABC-type antimicrobial peptide transport system permease subunit